MMSYRMARRWLACVFAIASAHGALAQQPSPDLTPAGQAILQDKLAADGRPLFGRDGPSEPMTFPLPMCAFTGGLCGAVNRDGSVAVMPRYDWVGTFHDGRAAVRLSGLYGFVDETGREIVPPHYRIVDDYKFGFTQVDVDGKSGLIDRDGQLVFAARYGFIEAIAPDRFRVSDNRGIGGSVGSENFSGVRSEYPESGGVRVHFLPFIPLSVIDREGRWIERPSPRLFDHDDPSLRLVLIDKRWGLQRADGNWLLEPKFEWIDVLSDSLALVRIDGKTGFIDRTGQFVIPPMLDTAQPFAPGFAYNSAKQDGSFGVIDRTGTWKFRVDADELYSATAAGMRFPFGWHVRKGNHWGLLDLDGHVLLDNNYDQPLQRCEDGRLVVLKNKEELYFKSDGSPLQPSDGRLIYASCGSLPPFILKTGDKFRLVDGDGKAIMAATYDALTPAGRNTWNAKIDGKWGRVGPDGHWLIEPKFETLSHDASILVASADGKRGFLRPDGSWLIEPRFDAARVRDSETAFVTLDGATGVLRLKDQSWAVPPRPGVMCKIPDGIMWQNEGRRALLSPNGDVWVDVGAERISFLFEAGLLTFMKDGKWGEVDTAGQEIVPPTFDAPVYFLPSFRGIAWAKHDGHWCPIDRRGHQVDGIACVDKDPLGNGDRVFKCSVEP